MTPSKKKSDKKTSLMDFMSQDSKKKKKAKNGSKKRKSKKKNPIRIADALVDTHKDKKKKQKKIDGKEGKASKKNLELRKKRKGELDFYEQNDEPFGENVFEKSVEDIKREASKSRYLRFLIENDMICDNMEKGLLLTVEYCGTQNKAYARFYDLNDQSIKFWLDNTDHTPYCLFKDTKENLEEIDELMNFEGLKDIEMVKKYDLMEDEEIEVAKLYGHTPTDVGGRRDNIKNILDGAWEAKIRYHHSYIYDTELIPGLIYSINDGQVELVEQDLQPKIEKEFMQIYSDEKPEFQNMAKKYLNIFSYPIPEVRRVAFDIEVDVPDNGQLPNTKTAKNKVISISFAASDGLQKVYVLWNESIPVGEKLDEFPEDAEIVFFKKERNLLKEAFRIIWDYPLVITFNGDNFDFNYLFHRLRRLKIPEAWNPIQVARGGGMVSSYAYLKYGVHLDLYQVFANRSLKGYAFGSVYERNSLDDITAAFLENRKFKHTEGEKAGEKFSPDDIASLDLHTLAHYNMMDSVITLELTQFNKNTVWNLLVYLLRITKLPFQDLFRHQISFWIRNLMFFEHRVRNYIIPRRSEIQKKKPGGQTKSVIEGKGFKGAYVIPPVPGIHFKVVVADFSSLYPSIIKSRNLSYETILCEHADCSDNFLPNIPYHVCNKRVGIFALVVGFLRDIRVKWFKPRSLDADIPEDDRLFAKVLQSALKVFINGSYGVFGSPNFPLFCLPVAEATTSIGRYAIGETIEKAESMGVKVLYGDTDSVFLDNPNDEQIQELIEWSQAHLKIDLEKEKTYQFLALSERKKNYVGIYESTKYIDIKGMTGKKSNTPPFIINAFKEITEMLTEIKNMAEFKKKKSIIERRVKQYWKKIGKPVDKGGYPIEDYAVTTSIKKKINQYKNVQPQHIKAAKMAANLSDGRIQYERGDAIEYVKTKDDTGVKPLGFAKIYEVDIDKYRDLLEGTFEQLLDALGITWAEIKGTKKLDSFF